MPTLAEATRPIDSTNFTPAETPQVQMNLPPQTTMNPLTATTMPTAGVIPDGLSQFNLGGRLPQDRIFTTPIVAIN